NSPERSLVHLLQSLGCLRRKIVRAQRRLDRTGDAGGDGAGVHRKRDAAAAHHVQGDPHPDGRARLRAGSSHPRALAIARIDFPEAVNSMSIESVRAFFAEKAPEITVMESETSSATVALAAGSNHGAVRITPQRMAELTDAEWVDVCQTPAEAQV